ncbi:MAG: hypothetical protein CMF31_07560 [Kordiimonas sp.]|nr:hypothetical protein [Kordiimonas sp.]
MTADEIQSAQDAIDSLSANYVNWTRDQVKELYRLHDQFQEADEQSLHSLQLTIYDMAHNIKGMGSSFNYPLMTDIGASLCLYLKKLGKDATAQSPVIEAHIKSLDTVINQEITGDGGEAGAELRARLSSLVEKSLLAQNA